MGKKIMVCVIVPYIRDQENKDNFKTGYKPGVDMS